MKNKINKVKLLKLLDIYIAINYLLRLILSIKHRCFNVMFTKEP